MRLLQLILGIQLLATPAMAAFTPVTCQGLPNNIFERVFTETGVTCGTYVHIETIAKAIQAFAPFESPVTLFINKKDYDSSADFGRVVILNEQQMAWEQVRTSAQTEKIWAHELGHIIFNDLLVKNFSPIRPFRDYMLENARLVINARNPKFNADEALHDRWHSDLGKARDLQKPYSEFFADLVAVLYAEDSDAMTKAMLAPGMPDSSKKKTLYYAFSGSYELSTWDEKEVHYYFAPARAYVGKYFLQWPMTKVKKQEVLRKVFKACLGEMKKHWEGGKTLPNVSETNRSLIAALSKVR